MNYLVNIDTTDELIDVLRTAIDLMPDAMMVADGNGAVLLANAKSRALFGAEEGELVTRNVTELLAWSGLEGFEEVGVAQDFFHQPARRPIENDISVELVRTDGSTFSARVSLSLWICRRLNL